MTSHNHNLGKTSFRDGNIPLYFQLFLKLKNDIILGEIEAGSRVPTIDELTRHYSVSHATLRRALSLLESEGLIIKKRGVGIVVRDRVDLPIWNPSSLMELKQRAQMDLIPALLSHGWIEPPKRIRACFAGRPGTLRDDRIFWARRLWVSARDARRKRVADAFYPADFVLQVGEDALVQTTFIEHAARHLPFTHLKIHQTLRPWICDPDTADLLGVPDGTPVFHRTWVFLDPQDCPLSVTETVTTANSLVREIVTELPARESAAAESSELPDKGEEDGVHPSAR